MLFEMATTEGLQANYPFEKVPRTHSGTGWLKDDPDLRVETRGTRRLAETLLARSVFRCTNATDRRSRAYRNRVYCLRR